jgi:hypothetical protein
VKQRLTILALTALVVGLTSVVLAVTSQAHAAGAMQQISGFGYWPEGEECPGVTGVDSDFAIKMEGGLDGCLYVTVETFEESPSGTYRERGKNLFVGDLVIDGETIATGTFEATYLWTAKFDEDGAEVWGRCHHPITAGSGTGVFDGVTGRFDMRDILDGTGGEIVEYTGHLMW